MVVILFYLIALIVIIYFLIEISEYVHEEIWKKELKGKLNWYQRFAAIFLPYGYLNEKNIKKAWGALVLYNLMILTIVLIVIFILGELGLVNILL